MYISAEQYLLSLLETNWKCSFMLEGYTTAEEGYNKGAVKGPLDVRNVKRLFSRKINGENF